MRYFRTILHKDIFFICPDGYIYCKVSQKGRLYSWNLHSKIFEVGWHGSVRVRTLEGGKLKLVDQSSMFNYINHCTSVEELTFEEFNNNINAQTYLGELIL